jgi:hypothetical protein
MIGEAHQRGVVDALTRFGIKTAAPVPGGLAAGAGRLLSGAKNVLFGQPGKAFVEGAGAFRPGGMLSHENVWWPSTKGLTGMQKALPWLQRAGTLAVPFQLMSSAHRDQNDGALSNALGAAGSIAGTMYGMPALGMVGAPMLSNALSRVGRGVGHMLGSKPEEPQQ